MREIEFLPESYVFALKKRTFVRVQFWLTVLIVTTLALWAGFDASRVFASERTLTHLHSELEESAKKVTEREQLRQLRDRLQQREKVDNSLGLQIEGSRLVALIDQCSPPTIALSQLTVDTFEHNRTLSQQASLRDKPETTVDRELVVSIKGVAPSNIEVATLLENLINTGVIDNGPNLVYARDAAEGKSAVCEFQIDFHLNLNAGGAK